MMKTESIILGAGCFWGVQYYFDQVPGVVKTTVGYSGGHTKNPSWEDTHQHETGHAEVVLVEYDPIKVSTGMILKHFFRMHNPTLLNTDGINVGTNYRSAVFYFNNEQKAIAENIKKTAQSRFDDPIITEIAKAGPFYPAEEFHQKFTQRTGWGMCHVEYEPIV